MPSTPTTRLRLEKQALGENSATWGAPKLNDVFDRLDEAVGGVEAISTTGGTTTLTSNNYATDQARKAVLVFSGTLASNATIIVPNVEKTYLCVNNTTGSFSLTVKTSGGTGYALRSGPNWTYCNGTNVVGAEARLDQVPLPTAALDLNTQRITNLGTPSASTDAATKAYVDAAVSTTPSQNLATSAGTALAPTYSWATDSNTGMYLVGSDSLGLSAGGTVRATVSSTGLAVSGTFSATGAMTASGGLGVTGAIATTGGVSVGTTLGVTGATTMGSTLGVTGATTLAAMTATTGSFSSTLGVTGAATLSSTLGVTGAVTAGSTITATGVILGPAGTIAAPSHSFSGDPDTGIRNSATNTLSIVTGGADRFTVDSTGIVRATADVRWEVGGNHAAGFKPVTTHQVGSAGETVFGVDDGGGWCGMAVTNVASGGLNSQKISFRTAIGGSVLATDRMTISEAGSVTCTRSGGSILILNETGGVTTQAQIFQFSGSQKGNIDVSSSGVTYNSVSDYRLKQDIEPLTGALPRLGQLQPKTFSFIADPEHAVMEGFIAHEVQTVIPSAVSGEKDATYANGQPRYQSMDASRIVPLLVAAVQELAARVEALENP